MTAGTVLDLIILGTLLLAVVNGFLTGFIIQFGRLFALVAGIWAMQKWAESVADWLTFVQNPSWRIALAALLILIVVLLGVALLARALKQLVTFSLGGALDKLFGALFSLLVGILFWALILMFVEKFFPNAHFLQDSRAVPWFNEVIGYCQGVFILAGLHGPAEHSI